MNKTIYDVSLDGELLNKHLKETVPNELYDRISIKRDLDQITDHYKELVKNGSPVRGKPRELVDNIGLGVEKTWWEWITFSKTNEPAPDAKDIPPVKADFLKKVNKIAKDYSTYVKSELI